MQTVSLYLKNSIYRGILRYDQKRGEKYTARNGKQPDRKKIPRAAHEIIEVRVFGGTGQLPQLIGDTSLTGARRATLTSKTRTNSVGRACPSSFDWTNSGRTRPKRVSVGSGLRRKVSRRPDGQVQEGVRA